jgi:methylmalonyl-CoA/ethylmalonyl-CoA epimerase
MKLTLNHIGIVIDKLDDVLDLFRKLGFTEMTEPVPNPLQRVSASFVPVSGDGKVYLEFLEPTEDSSPISSFIRKRGGGLHHLCFKVDDIDAAMAEVERHGFRITVPVEDCAAYDENLKRDCSSVSRASFFLLGNRILVEFIEEGA